MQKKPRASNQSSGTDYRALFPARAVDIAQLALPGDWDVMVDRLREWKVRGELWLAAADVCVHGRSSQVASRFHSVSSRLGSG